jgi:hypothetical protein
MRGTFVDVEVKSGCVEPKTEPGADHNGNCDEGHPSDE